MTSTVDHQNVVDLIFALNFSQPQLLKPPPVVALYQWRIYIPPEFTGILRQQIVTTITNQYDDIGVVTAGQQDPIGPGWTIISISTRAPYTMAFSAARQYREWYYVRVNAVVAPTIAGRYFFKMLLIGDGESFVRYPPDYSSSSFYVPVQNWPVVLVKGEVDPAIIYGTIRFGSWNVTLYGRPITLPGRVRAVGVANDPYTGESRGRLVQGRAYFNGTAGGHFELEGLAPGVYDIYASAAGYPEGKIASKVTVLKGQSLQLDGYLKPGTVLAGRISSKHDLGEETWSGLRPIRIEIYDNPRYTSGSLVAFSPWNMTSGVLGQYYDSGPKMSYNWIQGFGPSPRRVALEWVGPIAYYSEGTEYRFSGPICGGMPDPCVVHNGVGPAQFWWIDPNGWFTNGGGSRGFIFRFGAKGFFGAPTEIDGHVPQALATWINGLVPGRYYVRAFVNGYVQTEADGETFTEYSFDVAAREWPGNAFISLDLRKGGVVEKTIWFHDLKKTLQPSPVPSDRRIAVELRDLQNRLVAFNFTLIPAGQTRSTLLLNGLGMAGYLLSTKWSLFGFRGFGYEDYGIRAGIYKLFVYVRGYLEDEPETVTVGVGGLTRVSNHAYRGAVFSVSVRTIDWQKPPVERPWKWPGETMYVHFSGPALPNGPYFTLTQIANTPLVGPVEHDGYEYPDDSLVAGSIPGGYQAGTYSITAYTYGYVQKNSFQVHAAPGAVSDIKLDLVIGASILLTLKFRKESIFSSVPFNMSLRIRIFNQAGELVGAYVTSPVSAGTGVRDTAGRMLWYVPSLTETFEVEIAGIPDLYSDPVFGYYGQAPRGILGFPYYTGGFSIEIDGINWYRPTQFYPPAAGLLMGESYHLIPGHPAGPLGWTGFASLLPDNYLGPFAQSTVWSVHNAHLGGEASAVFALDLNGYLSGDIFGLTWSDELRTLSSVNIRASGKTRVFSSRSIDGFYELYLPAGSYFVDVTAWSKDQSYRSYRIGVSVSAGSFVQGINVYLQRSEIPIPEMAGLKLLIVPAVVLVVAFSKRLKKNGVHR